MSNFDLSWNPPTITTADRPFSVAFWVTNREPVSLLLTHYGVEWSQDGGRSWTRQTLISSSRELPPGQSVRLEFAIFSPWEQNGWRMRPCVQFNTTVQSQTKLRPGVVVVGQRSNLPIFLSRSLSDEDKPLGETVKAWLTQYELTPSTVGDPVPVPLDEVIRDVTNLLHKTIGVVVLATPRFIDQAGIKYTFEWAHVEAFGAVADEKPVLILCAGISELTGPLKTLKESGRAQVLTIPEISSSSDWVKPPAWEEAIILFRWFAVSNAGWRLWKGLLRGLPFALAGALASRLFS